MSEFDAALLPDCCEIVTCVLRWRVLLLPHLSFALCTNRYVRLVCETSNSVKSAASGRDWAGERSLRMVWAYTS